MAINYTVSYTYSPNTTISSSQVNTNFSDNANTWTGLEAGTKSFALLKVDGNPGSALEVAPKQYVDRYATWRRPNLVFGSITTVSIESGLDGTSGDIPMLFSDGSLRTETSATRTTFDITRNAVLTTSGAQSGLRATLSEASNQWYALYAVKVTDSSTLWCTVGDTLLPLQANFSTLNTNFGTNGWIYLGLIRNGDGGSTASDILSFSQNGMFTMFSNQTTGQNWGGDSGLTGIIMATSASATSLSYAYSAGSGSGKIPDNIGNVMWSIGRSNPGAARKMNVYTNGATFLYYQIDGFTDRFSFQCQGAASKGIRLDSATTAVAIDLLLSGFYDKTLGVGSNPVL